MANPARDSVDKLLSDFDNLGTAPGTTSGASASAAHKDAQSLLDDLDSLVQTPRQAAAGSSSSAAAQPSTPSRPSASTAAPLSELRAPAPSATTSASQPATGSAFSSSGEGAGAGAAPNWGAWGTSIWSSAAKLADQARAEIEKRAPPLTVSGTSADGTIVTEEVGGSNVQEASANAAHAANAAAAAAQGVLGRGFKFAEGVRGYVKESGWDKIGEDLSRVGRKGLKEIINAVAPPIAAHEVLQVTLSHDMIGYDGIEAVVFQVLAKVMEQVEQNDIEHQLVVNKAPRRPGGSLPKQHNDSADVVQERDLNAVEGFDAAFKLAEAELSALIKSRPLPSEPPASVPTSEPTLTNPTTTTTDEKHNPPSTDANANALTLPITECPLFIRVQPLFAPLPGHAAAATATSDADGISKHLFFAIVLQDPLHGLRHQTVSQAVPWSWMEVPFGTNAWVEQALVDVLHGALSIVGQDYVHGRSVAPATA